MQTFGNCNLLCQWIPKFNYALCEKLFWGLKHLTSFCFMFLIPVLWLKQTLSAPSPCLRVSHQPWWDRPCPAPCQDGDSDSFLVQMWFQPLELISHPSQHPASWKGRNRYPRKVHKGTVSCFILCSFHLVTIFGTTEQKFAASWPQWLWDLLPECC